MAICLIHFFVSGVILVDPSGIVSGEVRLIKLDTPITAYLKIDQIYCRARHWHTLL